MRTTHNCRWAEPTLYLPLPYWLDAWNAPWTCRRDEVPRLIETTDLCVACTRWAPRARTTPAAAESERPAPRLP